MPDLNPRLTLTRPVVFGTLAVAGTFVVFLAFNVVITRHYMLLSETEGVSGLDSGYWALLATVDLLLAGVGAVLVSFVVSNARQVLVLRRQDSFIDGVTHELKSPLASLRLGVDTLERPGVPEEVRDKLLDQMRGDVDRLQLFIEHILEAGRLQNRERSFELEPTAPVEVVERCVEQIRRRHDVPEDGISVDVVSGADAVTMADPVALEIALLNLLDNAVKYSTDATHVRVRIATEGPRLSIAVSDRGAGLARRERERVFNRFYRVAATRRIRGTGLGLYVSRGLVRQMGGDIRAESAGVGQGATFLLTLPRMSP